VFLAELQRAQEAGINMRDMTRRNHLARAELCSKIVEYSDIEDYVVYLSLEHQIKFTD